MADLFNYFPPSPKQLLHVRANEPISSISKAWKSLDVFQDEHEDYLEITFHRTLRVSEKDRPQMKTLPPGLGTFPVYNTEDFRQMLPTKIEKQGGAAFVRIYRELRLLLVCDFAEVEI